MQQRGTLFYNQLPKAEPVELEGTELKENIKNTDSKEIPPYVLVTEWENYFSYPTLNGLRALIFHAEKNGFDKVIRRLPRIAICIKAYYDWIEESHSIGRKITMHG